MSANEMQVVPRSAFARVGDVDIFYQHAGEGRPVVLLHGLDDTHRTWRHVVPELARSHRVVVPDLPGCGLSGRPNASYSLEWQARVMGAFLESVELEEVDLVGHSYGGGVAQYMLLEHRERIRRIALVASGGLGREVAFELRLASIPLVVEKLGQPFMAPVAPLAIRALGASVGPSEAAWIRQVNAVPGTARAFARTVRDVIDWRGQRRNFLDHIREVEVLPPMALFWGDDDRIIPLSQGIATKRTLEGAALTIFPGCGHFLHQERPADFARALCAFLDDSSARPVCFREAEPTPEQPGLVARVTRRVRRGLGGLR